MNRVLLAELAILVHFKPVRVVLLVLVGAVVAAMALRALQRDIVAHPHSTPYVSDYDLCFQTSPIYSSTPFLACQSYRAIFGNYT